MKNVKLPIISEMILTTAIIVALVMLLNPFNFIMTSAALLTILMLLAIALIAFGTFIWREQPRDEREALNGMRASRLSYFLGAGVITVAVVFQSLSHHLDVWLASALGVMVLTKVIASAWAQRR
jgi:4-amino-4-deoxy-L-arabinose transferase-like glycosyltransferase